MYEEYFTMPQRVTSSDGGGRLDILLSLRIGGSTCPAGGVGDFTTCSASNYPHSSVILRKLGLKYGIQK